MQIDVFGLDQEFIANETLLGIWEPNLINKHCKDS